MKIVGKFVENCRKFVEIVYICRNDVNSGLMLGIDNIWSNCRKFVDRVRKVLGIDSNKMITFEIGENSRKIVENLRNVRAHFIKFQGTMYIRCIWCKF